MGGAGAAYARDPRLRFVMSSGGMNFLEVARAMGELLQAVFLIRGYDESDQHPRPHGRDRLYPRCHWGGSWGALEGQALADVRPDWASAAQWLWTR